VQWRRCLLWSCCFCCFFFQAEDGIRDRNVTGVQTCALPIYFEVDQDELDDTPVLEIPNEQLSLLVNDLHVSYRVFGAKKVGHGPRRDWGVRGRLVRRGAKPPPVREVTAARGISVAARHGEALALRGVNGPGKPPLLRAIAGLTPPAAGTVHVAGNPPLLGVNAVLMKDLTGERNIMIGALALGLS